LRRSPGRGTAPTDPHRREHPRDEAIAQINTSRRAVRVGRVPFVIYGLVVPLINVLAAAGAGTGRRLDLFEDDAYYYFQIAHNIAAGAGSTFNGIDLTNGYHPLWEFALVPVYAVAPDKLSALVYVAVLIGVVWALAMFFAYRFARRLGREGLVAMALLPFVVLGSLLGYGPAGLYVSGMEVVLVALGAFVLLELSVARDVYRRTPPGPKALAGIGLVLAGIVLSRLDAIFLVAAYVLAALLAWGDVPWRARLRSSLILAGPTALLLLVYLAANAIWFGTATPVSGQAKSLGALNLGLGPLRQFLDSGAVQGHSIRLGWVTLALGVAAIGIWRTKSLGTLGPGERTLAVLLVVFGAALGLQIAYLSLHSDWIAWSWYFYLLPFANLLALVIVFAKPWSQLERRAPGMVIGASVVATAVVAAACVHHIQAASQPGNPRQDFIQASDAAARWLNAHTPRSSVLAMGDRAGSLGYLANRPVVQLEGLVESKRYLDALHAGRVNAFLRARHVSYLVISGPGRGAPMERPAPRGCVRHSEPGFGSGPKASVLVCSRDRLYYAWLQGDQYYAVYRYRAG
jgi:hypothetical protein